MSENATEDPCAKIGKHDAVHFHTRKPPHIWACVRCRKVLSPNPPLTQEEINKLIDFILGQREKWAKEEAAITKAGEIK